MWHIESAEFEPIADSDPGYQDPLVVHRHTDHDKALVIFVHGLGGHRYTTWGHLPRFFFEDLPATALGFYDYASGLRRLRSRHSSPLNVHATQLADTIRDGPYESVVLIGHSMGGLLAKATINQLIDTRTLAGQSAVARVRGLLLIATPQAGSLRVPGLATLLSRDARALRAHSAFVTDMTERFTNKVATARAEVAGPSDKVVVPTFAVLATTDTWVDRFSAGMGLTRDQTKTVRGSHTSIVKPLSRQDDVYGWILHHIGSCVTAQSTQSDDAPATRGTEMPPKPSTGEAATAEALVQELMSAARAQGSNVTISINVNLPTAPTNESHRP
jgi:pimeloyl-ACP methyl ester carboxylesterase